MTAGKSATTVEAVAHLLGQVRRLVVLVYVQRNEVAGRLVMPVAPAVPDEEPIAYVLRVRVASVLRHYRCDLQPARTSRRARSGL